jgi:quercetin dioxygenase-like cupin family protein
MIGQGEKVDESKGTTLEAGGYFVIPAKTPHWFKAVTDCTVIRYSAGAADTTYIEKKDK